MVFETKRCGGLRGKKSCGQWLPVDAFGSNNSSPDGKQHWCKACTNRAVRNGAQVRPEKNRSKVSAWKKANPDKNVAHTRRHRFGMDQAEYDAMLSERGGLCDRCSEPFKNSKDTHLDHDHACCPGTNRQTCGKCVRGILCHCCNVLLTVPYCKRYENTDAYLLAYRQRETEIAA